MRGTPSASLAWTNLDQVGSTPGHSADLCDAGRGEQTVAHQTISAYEVFRPEPMPSNKILSSACSWSRC